MGIWWWRLILLSVAGILFSPKQCASQEGMKYRFMKKASAAPMVSYYDYIIIGGGTAGCPLAATLSQSHKVLVLERGGSPYGNPNITDLAAFGAALSDTSPTSPAQGFVSQDGVFNSRARVLGGGSCINAGFYTRASAHHVREAGWDGRLVDESYKWVERKVAFKPHVQQWQSALQNGLLEVGVQPYNGFTFDHLSGTKLGGTIFDNNGQRHTAADLLEYANPDELTVLLHATVQRILFRKTGTWRPVPVANGVIFRDERGIEHTVYLNEGGKNEIIVSAGALGSPQVLMLSGIGAASELGKHNISVVLNQPLVGQGMSDNPMNGIYVPSPVPVEVSLIQIVGITNFGTFIEATSGRKFIANPTGHNGSFSPKIAKVGRKQGPEEAMLAKTIETIERVEEAEYRGGFILEKIIGPMSTGELHLASSDPNENPLVRFNYFKDPKDLERCVEGMRIIEKVIESKAFSGFMYKDMSATELLNITANLPLNLLPKHSNTSTSLEQFCKDTVMTIWHYHGGCQVGRVVDADYKVIGVDALRVIDGSTFNSSPGTNPHATLLMLGRYMGVTILKDRSPPSEATKSY